MTPFAARRDLALVVLLATSCASTQVSGRLPPVRDFYSRTLSNELGGRDSLRDCAFGRADLGAGEPARIRRFDLHLVLPEGFALDRAEYPRDSLWHPVLRRRWGGEEWIPGVYIESGSWYRWTRTHPEEGPSPVMPATLVQLTERSRPSYPLFQAVPPWRMTETEECRVRLESRTIRVARFALRHPTAPSRWGLVATWWGAPGRGAFALLALGPDEGVQAEVLAILEQVRH